MEPIKENPYFQTVMWHDLRNNPDYLPSENETVLNQYGQIVFRIGDIWFNDRDQSVAEVIVWCHIPTFYME